MNPIDDAEHGINARAVVYEIDFSSVDRKIIEHIRQNLDRPLCRFVCRSCDDVIEGLSYSCACALSLTAILYWGLSTNDFNSGFQKYVFAAASLGVNYVQIAAVQQLTFKRYLTYFKNGAVAIRAGRKGVSELLGIAELPHLRQKMYIASKSAIGFVLLEGVKGTILCYASVLPSALAKQVSWLNNEIFIKILRAAVIVMLQEPVHQRVANFRLPVIMTVDNVRDQVQKFRHVISELLCFNKYEAQDNRFQRPQPVDTLLAHIFHRQDADDLDAAMRLTPTLMTLALNMGRNGTIKPLLSNRTFYIAVVTTAVLVTSYGMSNSGNYNATFENGADPIESRVSSIVGDFLFGLYMAIGTGTALAYHFRRFMVIVRHHWRELVWLTIAMGLSSLTVGSTLAVANSQQMPLFIKIGTIPGTIFDNTNFLAPAFFYLVTQLAFRWNNPVGERNKRRHDRAVIANFYDRYQYQLGLLNDCQFMDYIRQVCERDPIFLQGYQDYLYKMLPWTRGLSLEEVITTLSQSPNEAITIINRSGRFGLRRRVQELCASSVATAICALIFIPTPNQVVHIMSQYVCPTLSIASGVAVIGLFGCYQQRGLRNHLNPSSSSTNSLLTDESDSSGQQQIASSSAGLSVLNRIVKSLFVLGMPLALRWSTKMTSYWVYQNIFNQEQEQAVQFSEYTANAVTVVGVGFATKAMGVDMR